MPCKRQTFVDNIKLFYHSRNDLACNSSLALYYIVEKYITFGITVITDSKQPWIWLIIGFIKNIL